MKTKLLIAFLLAHLTAMSQITTTGGYCQAEFDGGTSQKTHYISSFSFGNFTNVSGTVQQPFPHYIFYNNLSWGPFQHNYPYNVSVNVDSVGDKDLVMFIDYNKDGFFDNIFERVWSTDVNAGDANVTGIVSIPFGVNSSVRLRLILFEDSAYALAPACFTTLDWGETEDYEIQLGFTSSVSEQSIENFLIYPNPTSGIITIDTDRQIDRIEVYDLAAKKVLVDENNLSGSLDIRVLESGTYILIARTVSGSEIRRLIFKN